MLRTLHALLLLICLLAVAMPLRAQSEAGVAELRQRLQNLKFQTGTVALPRAHARMEIPPGWKFLATEELARIFEVDSVQLRDLDELGLLLPETMRLDQPNVWYITVAAMQSGYIVEDVDRLEPYRLVWRARDVYKWASQTAGRYKAESFEFVNFGRAPYLDSTRHYCIWSERIRYPQDKGAEYLDIYAFALSRRGAVSVSAEYMPDQWQDQVEHAVEALVKSIRFDIGERYEDYSAIDEVADFELSHIITGELWIGPQTWTAWLQQPVKLPLGSGWKRMKIKVPNWAFWGAVLAVGGFVVMRWMRGSGSAGRTGRR